MKRVRFTGRGRLAVFGYMLRNGDSAVMSDEQAAELEANPRISVTVTDFRADVKPEAGNGEGQHTNRTMKRRSS